MEVNADNPLLNPLIIKEVYKKLDFFNKKSFRLVCRTWTDAILDLWRKQSRFVMEHKEYKTDGRLNPRSQTADFILEYFDLYKITKKPLVNLKLYNMEFSFLPKEFLQNVQDDKNTGRIPVIQSVQNLLAENFGHSLERLELVECTFLQQGKPEAGFYHILLKYFSKLKVLSVRQPNITPSFGHELILNESSFPKTQSDLITFNLAVYGFKQHSFTGIPSLMPSLKNLSLRGAACEAFKAFSSPFSSSGSHILLDKLGIDIVYDTQKLVRIPTWIKNYVDAARPSLKCLKACLPFGPFPKEVDEIEFPEEPFIYKPVWNCVGNTLSSINLRIWMGRWSWCTLLTGSFLPNLTHLCLTFRELNTLDAKLNAVDFLHFDFGMLRGTPLLKQLHLELDAIYTRRTPEVGTNLEENQLEWRGNAGGELRSPIVLEHMEDFRFELYHKPTQGCWKAFARMMPNLRKLQGMVDEDTDPLVRQLWPDLKLECSILLLRKNLLTSQITDPDRGTISFRKEWQEVDWENWSGNLE